MLKSNSNYSGLKMLKTPACSGGFKHFVKVVFTAIMLFYSSIVSSSKFQDSLIQKLQNSRDTVKVKDLIQLSISYQQEDNRQAQYYAELAMQTADSLQNNLWRLRSRSQLGVVEMLSGKYEQSVSAFINAITIAKSNGFQSKLCYLYNRVASTYYYWGKYDLSLQYYLMAESEAIKTSNNWTLFDVYSGMANLFLSKNDIKSAEKFYIQARDIAVELKDNAAIAFIENDIGVMFLKQKMFHLALSHYQKGLKLYALEGDSANSALSFTNIGSCYTSLALTLNKPILYDSASYYYQRAELIYTHIKDENNLILCYISIAQNYNYQKNYTAAIEYLNRSLEMSTVLGRKEYQMKCYQLLADVYNKVRKFKEAYTNSQLYADMRDTLLNETNTRNINELQTKYDTDKKEMENKRLNLEKEKQASSLRQDKIIMYFLIALSILGLIVIFVIYNQFRQKQRANIELEEKNNSIRRQKREIEKATHVLEIQHKEITDSINYAKQIQQAILPSKAHIDKVITDYFILYKPKAVVSGDFYFFSEKSDCFYFAAVDCTGHGVPGAFMSMIGHNLLTHLINERNLSQPSEILEQLHIGVRTSLQQDIANTGNRDGMDIAIVCLRKDHKQLEYAGANRPLYLIRNGKLYETKGDKYPIGGIQDEQRRVFNNHKIDLNSGDTVYLFSDGYADQFGGERGKKFMVKNFQQTLKEIQKYPMPEQQVHLDQTITEWKGNQEQIDDILVIGIKV